MGRWDELDKQYREEGWGKITDQALGIRPMDVESQARDVARWAYDKITELEGQIQATKDERSAATRTPHLKE